MSIFGKGYKYHLGYALSGGGAKGFAHLGALKVLENNNLKPDIIAGTSAGALAGVFYADGFAPDEIKELFEKKEFREFVTLSIPKRGFFKSTGLTNFLKKNLRSKSFEELPIPLKVVASDWEKASTVVFDKGKNLIEAVVASCSVPVVFHPQYIDERPFVDGGLLKNFPVSVIREECKFVLGINVSLIVPILEKSSIISTTERTFNIMSNSNTLEDRELCDILIEVSGLHKYSMFTLQNTDAIMEKGYTSATKVFKKEKTKKIVDRCLRYYQLEKIVKKQITKIK